MNARTAHADIAQDNGWNATPGDSNVVEYARNGVVVAVTYTGNGNVKVRDAHDAATARGLTGAERRTYVANYANNCQENAESQYRAEIERVRAATGYRSITPAIARHRNPFYANPEHGSFAALMQSCETNAVTEFGHGLDSLNYPA